MTFKVVNISDPGTGTRHGADDQDKIAKYLNGVDITDPAIINTDTIFKSNKLGFRDASDLFNIHIITSAETMNSTMTIPTLNGNATMLLDNDARLYDTRDPNLHSLTHQLGQPDEILLDELGLPTDVTALNSSPQAHGLMPKLSADGLTYLDGNGNWTSPSGTGILADGSITNAKLADETITASKIAPAAVTNSEVAPAAAIAYSKLALTGAILNADINTSAAIAWTKVSKTGSKLEDMADVNITGRGDQMLIKWDTTTSKYVFYTPSTSSGAVIPDDNSVSAAKIQTDAVTTIKILAGNVTTAKIANLAVTTALIADANVTLAKLASNSVDSSKIVDGSILNADVNTSAAIAWTKISKTGAVITDMGNVSVSSPSTGQVLTYSAGTWINQTPSTPATSGDSANPTAGVKTGWIMGGMSSTNDSTGGGGILAMAQFENEIDAGVDSDGAYSELTTTSTSQTFARIYTFDSGAPFMGSLNPKLTFRFKLPTAANIRIYMGYTDEGTVPNNQYTILNSQNGFGVMFDTTNATTFRLLNCNGGATQTDTDTGITPGSGTVYTIILESIAATSTWKCTINGTTFTKTTNVPSQSLGLGWGIMCNTHTSAVRTLRLYYLFARQDA
jgi:hypothetical protein